MSDLRSALRQAGVVPKARPRPRQQPVREHWFDRWVRQDREYEAHQRTKTEKPVDVCRRVGHAWGPEGRCGGPGWKAALLQGQHVDAIYVELLCRRCGAGVLDAGKKKVPEQKR